MAIIGKPIIPVCFYVENLKNSFNRPAATRVAGQFFASMAVIPVLVILSILIAGGFLIAFLWSVRSGQYEDTYAPSVRILFDDPPTKKDDKAEENADDSNNFSSDSLEK